MRKRRDETFTVFNFDELWTRYSDVKDTFLCVSERHIVMLLTSLRPASWASRWVGDNPGVGGDDYERALLRANGRLDDLETALSYTAELENILMTSCAEAMLQGMTAIADAIKTIKVDISQICGSNSVSVPINNYIQGVTPGGNPIYGSAPPKEETANTPPAGFDGTWEQWLAKKCQAANVIVDGLIASMRGLAVLDIALLIQTGAAAGVIAGAIAAGVTVPFIAIPALVAAMVALGLSLGALNDTADYWSNHRDTFVCGLYNSDNTTEAITVVEGYIDEALGAIAVAAPLHPAIRTIGLLLASTDTLDSLFDVGLAISYPDADCSACDAPWFEIPSNQTLIDGSLGQETAGFEIQASENPSYPGNYYVDITNTSGQCLAITVVGGTNYTPQANVPPGSNTLVTNVCDASLYGHGSASPIGQSFNVGDGQTLHVGAGATTGTTVTVVFTVSTEV